MTDESTAEAWLDSLQENLERDLIETGFISGATREFWTIIGYDDPENPNYETSREYVYAISERLKVPPTNDLDELEQEYQKRHYTRRCLQFGQPASQCLIGASEYGHLNVVRESVPLFKSRDKGDFWKAVAAAIKHDNVDIIKVFDTVIETRNPDEDDEKYKQRVDDEIGRIMEWSTQAGSLEILKHEVERRRKSSAEHGYNLNLDWLFYSAVLGGHLPTLKYLVDVDPENARYEFNEMVFEAAVNGKIDIIKYLLAWSQSTPDPLSIHQFLLDAIEYRPFVPRKVFDAFIDDVNPDSIASLVERSITNQNPTATEYILSYAEQRGIKFSSLQMGIWLNTAVQRADFETAESIAARYHRDD